MMKGFAVVKPPNSENFKEYDFTNFELKEFPIPKCEKNQVLIKIKAVSLNPVDYKMACKKRSGNTLLTDYPSVVGVDGSGIIEESQSSLFKKGDRVMIHQNLWKRFGTFAEYICVPDHVVAKIPDEISYEEAAAIPCAGYTAYLGIYDRLNVTKGQTILINGGSGGVGSFAIQYAKERGAKVFTTVSKQNFEFVKSIGADVPIDYKNEKTKDIIMKETENGVDACLDCFGPSTATEGYVSLCFNGKIATIAGAPDLTKVTPFTKCPGFLPVALGAVYKFGTKKDQSHLQEMGAHICQMILEKKVRVVIAEKLKFSELVTGLRKLRDRNTKPGKIVLTL